MSLGIDCEDQHLALAQQPHFTSEESHVIIAAIHMYKTTIMNQGF